MSVEHELKLNLLVRRSGARIAAVNLAERHSSLLVCWLSADLVTFSFNHDGDCE